MTVHMALTWARGPQVVILWESSVKEGWGSVNGCIAPTAESFAIQPESPRLWGYGQPTNLDAHRIRSYIAVYLPHWMQAASR